MVAVAVVSVLPLRLRRWLLPRRIAFHDWMWSEGGPPSLGLKRLCQRLPFYFSDPYMDGVPRSRAKFDKWFATLEPVEVVTSPTLRINSTPGMRVIEGPQTWSNGIGTTVHVEWTGPPGWSWNP